MTRDVSPRLNFPKPALIHSCFFPALQGPQSKMAASVNNSAIFLTDSPKEIKNKVGLLISIITFNHLFVIRLISMLLAVDKTQSKNIELKVEIVILTFLINIFDSSWRMMRNQNKFDRSVKSKQYFWYRQAFFFLQDYTSGKLLSGELKKILVDVLQQLVGQHQEKRKDVTMDVVRHFMTPRQLKFARQRQEK